MKVFHSCHGPSCIGHHAGATTCRPDHTSLESLTTFSPIRATLTNSQKALDGTVPHWNPQLLVLGLASRGAYVSGPPRRCPKSVSFESIQDIMAATTAQFKTLVEEDLQNCFGQWRDNEARGVF